MLFPKRINTLYKNPVEIGYIIISGILNRDEYISNVLRTHRASVVTYSGTVHDNCPIMLQFGNDENGSYLPFNFPADTTSKGSCVVLLNPYGSTIPVIIGIVPTLENKVILDNEFQNKNIIDSDECNITYVNDPQNGRASINVYGKQASKGNFNISVGSVNNDANVTIDTQGDLNLNATNNLNLLVQNNLNITIRNKDTQDNLTSINYTLGQGLTITDEFNNVVTLNQEGGVIQVPKIRLGDDNVESLKKILVDLFKAIQNISVQHPEGATIPETVINWSTDFQPVLDRINSFMGI